MSLGRGPRFQTSKPVTKTLRPTFLRQTARRPRTVYRERNGPFAPRNPRRQVAGRCKRRHSAECTVKPQIPAVGGEAGVGEIEDCWMGAARCDRMRLSTPDTGSRQRVNNGDCSILDAIIVNLSCATVRELRAAACRASQYTRKQPRHTSVVQDRRVPEAVRSEYGIQIHTETIRSARPPATSICPGWPKSCFLVK